MKKKVPLENTQVSDIGQKNPGINSFPTYTRFEKMRRPISNNIEIWRIFLYWILMMPVLENCAVFKRHNFRVTKDPYAKWLHTFFKKFKKWVLWYEDNIWKLCCVEHWFFRQNDGLRCWRFSFAFIVKNPTRSLVIISKKMR